MSEPETVDLTNSADDEEGDEVHVDDQLIEAVENGPFDRVEQLLTERAANPNATDNDGWTCLHHCAYEGKIVKACLLLQYGADINATLWSNERTAMHVASTAENVDFIEFLVERGADVNAADNRGWTPLHCAVECRKLRSIRVLVEQGADKEATDNEGKKPHDYALPFVREVLEGIYRIGASDNNIGMHAQAAAAPAVPHNGGQPAAAPAVPHNNGRQPQAPAPAVASQSFHARLRRLERFSETNSQGNLRARIIKLETLCMGRNNTGNIPRRLALLEENTGVLEDEN